MVLSVKGLAIVIVAATGSGSKALRECEAGRALTPAEHLRACAGLIKGPGCREYLLSLDGGAFELLDFEKRCQHEYCARFKRPNAFCSGERGTPASGFVPELDFLNAVFEVDHGDEAPKAKAAFSEAAGRELQTQVDAANAERKVRAEKQRHARLILDLVGDSENVSISFVRPEGRAGFSGPVEALGPAACRALLSRALDGGSLGAGQPVVLRAGKRVTFRSIRCVTNAVLDAGASWEDIVVGVHEP
jgi:hypothetical protein